VSKDAAQKAWYEWSNDPEQQSIDPFSAFVGGFFYGYSAPTNTDQIERALNERDNAEHACGLLLTRAERSEVAMQNLLRAMAPDATGEICTSDVETAAYETRATLAKVQS
jgi:hypothetical protein